MKKIYIDSKVIDLNNFRKEKTFKFSEDIFQKDKYFTNIFRHFDLLKIDKEIGYIEKNHKKLYEFIVVIVAIILPCIINRIAFFLDPKIIYNMGLSYKSLKNYSSDISLFLLISYFYFETIRNLISISGDIACNIQERLKR